MRHVPQRPTHHNKTLAIFTTYVIRLYYLHRDIYLGQTTRPKDESDHSNKTTRPTVKWAQSSD